MLDRHRPRQNNRVKSTERLAPRDLRTELQQHSKDRRLCFLVVVCRFFLSSPNQNRSCFMCVAAAVLTLFFVLCCLGWWCIAAVVCWLSKKRGARTECSYFVGFVPICCRRCYDVQRKKDDGHHHHDGGNLIRVGDRNSNTYIAEIFRTRCWQTLKSLLGL